MFYARLQQLLRVLNLASKPKTNESSFHSTVEAISTFRRRNNGPLKFSGPNVTILEREGELLELLTEAFCALGEKGEFTIATSIGRISGHFFANIRTSTGPKREAIDGYLKQSMLIDFLQADGVIQPPVAEDHAVTFSGVLSATAQTFTHRARTVVEFPFSGTTDEAQSAMRKILHDLKNHLNAAQIAATRPAVTRTDILRRQAEVSTHLDAVDRAGGVRCYISKLEKGGYGSRYAYSSQHAEGFRRHDIRGEESRSRHDVDNRGPVTCASRRRDP